MKLAFWRRNGGPVETRGYSDTLTELLVARAAGSDDPSGSAHLTGAVEACAGLYARAFAGASVTPEDAADPLTPSLLARIARSLIVAGESLHLIEVRGGEVRLIPVGTWEVTGSNPDPRTWAYKVDLESPDGTTTVTRPAAAVLHVRYGEDASRPWQGVGPLARAGLSSDLLSALETRLKQEAGATSAYVVPDVTVDPNDPTSSASTTKTLRSDLKAAKGGIVLAPSMWGYAGDAAGRPAADWGQRRIGAEPPDVLRLLRTDAGRSVMAACGCPESLFTDADGTAQREAWRRFCHGSVKPLARIVEAAVRDALDVPDFALSFDDLYASDVVGRAQAFNRMVSGGMDVAEAAGLSGLIGADE